MSNEPTPEDEGLITPVVQGLAEARKGIEHIEEVTRKQQRIQQEADADVWAFIRWWEKNHPPAARAILTWGEPQSIPKGSET